MDPTYILRVWMYGSYIYPESMNEWILPISWEYVCEDPSERQRTGSDPEYLIELIDTDVLGVVCLNKKKQNFNDVLRPQKLIFEGNVVLRFLMICNGRGWKE